MGTPIPKNLKLFEDKVLTEVIKLKWGHQDGPSANIADEERKNQDSDEMKTENVSMDKAKEKG